MVVPVRFGDIKVSSVRRVGEVSFPAPPACRQEQSVSGGSMEASRDFFGINRVDHVRWC